MYEVNGIKFDSYLKAVAHARELKLEVHEVREDGSKICRWHPPALVTPEKMRRYRERMSAWEAQERMKAK